MQIPCCHCGPRGHEEFNYFGDAAPRRPAWLAGGDLAKQEAAPTAYWHDYVHLRDNPSGPHRELWQHTSGCRAWLVVTHDGCTIVERREDWFEEPTGTLPGAAGPLG